AVSRAASVAATTTGKRFRSMTHLLARCALGVELGRSRKRGRVYSSTRPATAPGVPEVPAGKTASGGGSGQPPGRPLSGLRRRGRRAGGRGRRGGRGRPPRGARGREGGGDPSASRAAGGGAAQPPRACGGGSGTG